jgi:hypothetical protein
VSQWAADGSTFEKPRPSDERLCRVERANQP